MSYNFGLSNRQEYLRKNSIQSHMDLLCSHCGENIKDENLYVGRPKAIQVDYERSMPNDAEDSGRRKIEKNKHYHQACYKGQK